MKVLIAEDHDVRRMLLCHQLDRLGYECEAVASGDEAWDRLDCEDWRLLITDWEMPGLDGPDLCRRLRARYGHPYTYVILLRTRGSRDDRFEGLAAGADDFLVAPCELAELESRLVVAHRILDAQASLEELARTDPLTGLANRRRVTEAIEAARAASRRSGSPLSVIVADVDHFKSYNDEFGHAAGDEALKMVADALRAAARAADVVGRLGGEEFIAIAPATDAAGATELAERMRRTVAGLAWPMRAVTVSLGVATAAGGTSVDPAALTARADLALYHSKGRGRDCVTATEEEEIQAHPAGPAHEGAVDRRRDVRRKGTLLVVEDDDSSRKAVARLMRHRGWAVREAASACEALDMLDPAPDAVLLDLMLPGADGEVLARAIRHGGLRTRIVVYTGVADPQRLAEARSMGLVVLSKPASADELEEALQARVDDRRLRPTADRRSSKRVQATSQPATLAWNGAESAVRVIDISQGGAMVATEGGTSPAGRVRLHLVEPSGACWVAGRVARNTGPGLLALSFDDPCPTDVLWSATLGVGFEHLFCGSAR